MRYIILLLGIFICSQSIGQQSIAGPALVNAASATAITAYPPGAVSAQAESWQMEKNRSPQNATAWFNYYIWTERDKQLPGKEKKLKLSAAIADAQKHISQTAEYGLMLYLESGRKDSVSLFHALAVAADKSLVYPYIVQYYIIQQNLPGIIEYSKMLDEIKPLTESIHTYHYNVLMSADSNAVIYGKGLYDLVPMAQAQYAHKVRRDIRLKYYNGTEIKEPNAYLCLSLGKEILSKYPAAAYTGLLVKVKGSKDISELKRHIEKDMNLWFLGVAGYWEDAEQLYKNYLPSFILMYRHYKDRDDYKKQERFRYLIDAIARKAGISNEIDQLLEK